MSGVTLFRIASLYAIPALAVLAMLAVFCVLLTGVRQGRLSIGAATTRLALMLLLPIASVVALWLVTELGSFALLGDAYAFDGAIAVQTLAALLPIALWLTALVVLLLAVFPFVARRLRRAPGAGAGPGA